MDFYVYGGFDVTVNAFLRIAMIFSDGEYVVMFFVATMFGIFFGGMIAVGQGLLGMGGNNATVINFLVLVMVGVAVFKGLIMPKGTVHIYDPVVNRYQAVGNVPDLIVLAAGMTNKMERVLTEIMDNGSAHPRTLQGGGVGLELLINAFRGEQLGSEAYIQRSVNRYIRDCLPPAESLNSYTFDLQKLKSDTGDIKAELAKLRNPAVFTTVYSAANKAGASMSCTQAWDTYLNSTLDSPALYEEYVEHVCAQSGFAVHDPSEAASQMLRCKAIIEDAQDLVFDAASSGNYRRFMQDIMLSKSIVTSLADKPGSALSELANKDIAVTGMSSQIVSEGWLPAIKAIVFGVVLGLMPILAMFVVTPLVFKSVHLMLGLMLWLALWGVTDSVVHGIAMDQVISMTEGIKNLNMSLGALLMLPDQATKGLAIIGKAQSMGVILATFIAGVFFKISGYAFTQLSEKWSQDIDRFGDKAGQETLDPIGRVETLQRQTEGQAKMTAMGNLGLEGFTVANQMMTNASYNQSKSNYDTLKGQGYTGHEAISEAGVFEGGSQAGNRIAQDELADKHYQGDLGSAGSHIGHTGKVIELADTRAREQALDGVYKKDALADSASEDARLRHIDQASATKARADALTEVHDDKSLVDASLADSTVHQVDQVASNQARADALTSVHADKSLAGASLADSTVHQVDQVASNQARADALTSVHADKSLVGASLADSTVHQVDQVASNQARADALTSVHAGKTLTDASKTDSAMHHTDQVAATKERGDLAAAYSTTGLMTEDYLKLNQYDQTPLKAKLETYQNSSDYARALETSEAKFSGEMQGLEQAGFVTGQGVDRLGEYSGLSQGYSMAGTGQAYSSLSAGEIIKGYEVSDLSNAVDGNVVSNIAAQEGYPSEKAYIEAQKDLGRHDELANLINAQRLMGLMGWDEKDVALAKNGTNWEMSLTGDQMDQMISAGMFSPMDDRYYGDGGILNVNMAGDGSAVSVFAKAGTAEQVNDSLEVSRGMTLNQGIGQINPGSFAYALENRHGESSIEYATMFESMENPAVRESTLSQMAQELDSTLHSGVTYQDAWGHREDIAGRVGIPGFASLVTGLEVSAGASAFNEGSMLDQDSFNTNKMILNSFYEQSHEDAQEYIDQVYRPHAQGASPQDIQKAQNAFAADKFANYYTEYRDSILDLSNNQLRGYSDQYDEQGKPDYSDVKIPDIGYIK